MACLGHITNIPTQIIFGPELMLPCSKVDGVVSVPRKLIGPASPLSRPAYSIERPEKSSVVLEVVLLLLGWQTQYGPQKLSNPVGVLHRDGLSLTELAKVVFQLREAKDVRRSLQEITTALLDRYRQRLVNLEAVVRRDMVLESVVEQ